MGPSELALLRFQAVSAYLSLDPPRGQRRDVLERLAQKLRVLPDGREVTFSAETLRSWVRRYNQGGLAALEDRPRPRPGVQVLTPDEIAIICRLKREVPERSLDRLRHIAIEHGLLSAETSRSTIHRVLQQEGLSKRPRSQNSTKDLDRFEAAAPNDLWQSDMLVGPWLPDPRRPGKHRRAYLYAFIDDHSRLLLAGRFAFKGDLPALELVFREALRRHGVPRRVYYDNGKTYRSRHMRVVCAELGVHGMVFTRPYRPEGHGKIEAFNRFCTAAFIAEVKASPGIRDLDSLNLAFRAWVERYYNERVHAEILETPSERWRRGLAEMKVVDEVALRRAFLWSEDRTPDKTGLLSLFGVRYQVGPTLARKRVQVRFDPERLDEVEIWHGGSFVERVQRFEVRTHRRAVQEDPELPAEEPSEPVADFLGKLVRDRKDEDWDGEAALQRALAERQADDDTIVEHLRDRLAADTFDEDAVRAFLHRYGPLDPRAVVEAIDFAVELGGIDQHVDVLLGEILTVLEGGAA